MRLICGFSGAGKTSWAAQTAAHSGSACAYFDAGDIEPTALASTLCAGMRRSTGRRCGPGKALLPGASGLESLRALDRALQEKGGSPILVIDNAHALPSTALDQIARNATSIRLVLLCHPGRTVAELEALRGIQREDLRGWSVRGRGGRSRSTRLQRHDRRNGASASPDGRLSPCSCKAQCAWLHRSTPAGIDAFVQSLEGGLHGAATAQEVILERVFDRLLLQHQLAACALCFSDVPLSRAEMLKLLTRCLDVDEASAASIVRQLKHRGWHEVLAAIVRVFTMLSVLWAGFDPTKRQSSRHGRCGSCPRSSCNPAGAS